MGRARIRPHGTRATRRTELGAGRLKTVIVLAVVALIIYSVIKVVPPYVNDYQLADKMQEVARFAVVNRYSEDQIRENIYKVVLDLGIPAKKEDIKVFASNTQVKISMEYTVPIDILAYHTELHFSPTSEGKALI